MNNCKFYNSRINTYEKSIYIYLRIIKNYSLESNFRPITFPNLLISENSEEFNTMNPLGSPPKLSKCLLNTRV